jgi:hypothetical protein
LKQEQKKRAPVLISSYSHHWNFKNSFRQTKIVLYYPEKRFILLPAGYVLTKEIVISMIQDSRGKNLTTTFAILLNQLKEIKWK